MTTTKRAPKLVAVGATTEEEATSVEEALSTPTEGVSEAAEVDDDGEGVEETAEAKPKRKLTSHANCDHPPTKAARAVCRRARAKEAEATSIPDAEARETVEV